MGLQVALVDHRHAVGVLEHQVGLGEALGHVAPVEVGLLRDVDGLGRLGVALGGGHARVRQRLAGVRLGPRVRHRRRAGLHRQERVDRDRQHLVLDLDQVERFLGDRELVGRHGRHRLAGEDGAVDGEHRVGARRRLLLELGDVGRGEHRAHARERARRLVSIRRMRAWACGLRRSFACSMPLGLRSATYGTWPVTFSGPSGLGMDSPTPFTSRVVFIAMAALLPSMSG